jgi:alkylhydroperoxidase/carboxymuconolactone decarboxylase family protein YurZ
MATRSNPEEVLGGLADANMPVLAAIAKMHLDTVADSNLDERTFHLVRLAALAAVDAPPASYLVHLSVAAESGVTLEEFQGTLVAIAPIVGSPRITAAAGNVLRGLGLAAGMSDA